MIQTLFQGVLRASGAVASALTGLGAICTAAGFLAERTRWSMLGLGSVGVDFNEYLFVGSRFLAFLPGILLTTALAALTGSGRMFLLAVAVVTLALASRALFRREWGVRLRQRIVRWADRRRRSLLFWGLLALAALQFSGTLFLFRAAGLRNLLFAEAAPATAGCGDAGLSLEAQIQLGCEAWLDQTMGEVFLVVIASGVLLWLLLRASGAEWDGPAPGAGRGEGVPSPLPAEGAGGGADERAGGRESDSPRPGSLGEQVLVAVNVSLLAVQLILLPINYGALYLRNEFPVVEVALPGGVIPGAGERAEASSPERAPGPAGESPTDAATRSSAVWPASDRFYLLQRRGDELYLYSRDAARVWLVRRESLAAVVYLGICRLFGPGGSPAPGPGPGPGPCTFEEARP